MDELAGYKVADLRQALKERGLSHTGTKNELVARLSAAMSTEKGSADDSVIDDSLLDEDSMLAGEDDESSAEDVETSDLENPTGNGLSETGMSVAATVPGRVSPLKKQNGASSTNDDGESAAKKLKLNREPVQTVQPSKVAPTSPKKAIIAVTTESTVSGTSESTPKVPVQIDSIKILTAEERAALRAQKFGNATAEAAPATGDKKETRAARFGIKGAATAAAKTPAAPASAEELARLEKRRQRFGLEAASKETVEVAKEKRAQRFGGATAAAAPSAETDEKKKTRAARFGIS